MKRQRGMMALEMALLLPVLLLLLTAVMYYGRLTYHYAVAFKAAHDSARYLSSVAVANMRNPTQANYESNLAQAIAQAELAALGSGQPLVYVYCDNIPCAAVGNVLNEVSVTVVVEVPHVFLGYLPDLLGQRLTIISRKRYVGN